MKRGVDILLAVLAVQVVAVFASCGLALAVEVSDTAAPAPVAASPDTAIAGVLPGAARYGDAYCARVAGNIHDTSAQCGAAQTQQAAADSSDIDPGQENVVVRPDGSQLSYAEAFAEASDAGEPLAFWAGASQEAADYVLYVPAGAIDEGYLDFRLTATDGADETNVSFDEQLGRSDILVFSYVEQGMLPSGCELYLRVSSMFGNASYVNVYESRDGGVLNELATGIPVENGYVLLKPADRGSFVLVNASDDEAAGVTTDRFFVGAQTENTMAVNEAPVGAILGFLLAFAIAVLAIALVVRSTKGKASRSTTARARARSSQVKQRNGKRGGLS